MSDTQSQAGKIRLAFLVRSLDFGGAQRQLVTLAKALDKNQFEVSILTFYSGQPLEQELENTSVRLVSLNKSGRWDLLPFLGRLIRETRALRPDILHGYLDIPNVLALFLKGFVRARIVWGVRASAMELRRYDWLFRLAARVEQWLSRFPDLIIVNSVAARDYHVANGFPAHKLKLIPNGIDTQVFKPDTQARRKMRNDWGISETTRLSGTVGRLDPVKDLPDFLQAAALINRELTETRFICVGTGPAHYVEHLKYLAHDLGIAESVIWEPARQDIAAAYNALDLLVSSSQAESFPNSVAEAMSCGVPCIVTDVGDSALLVGDNGTVVPPRNPQALATAIISSLEANRIERRLQTRNRIVANFSVEQLVFTTQETLISLCRN